MKDRGIIDRLERDMTLLSGMAIGAMAMYMLDPQRGAARRSYARDKLVRAGHELALHANRRARDLANRAWGQVAEWSAALKDNMQQIPDETLRQRVRAQLGHVVSHPGSLEIDIRDGIAHISGPVLRGERSKIEGRLAKTRGVKECRIEVTEHEPGSDIPGLQGQSRTRRAG
jgi:hypothetical protein